MYSLSLRLIVQCYVSTANASLEEKCSLSIIAVLVKRLYHQTTQIANVASTYALLCARPNRLHYGSCPSVRPSVCLFPQFRTGS